MMVEIIIFLSLICLTVVLIVVKGLRFVASTASEYELTRQAQAGNTHAAHELKRRELLPMFNAVQKIVELLGLAAILLVAFTGLPPAVAALVVLLLLFLSELVATRKLLARLSASLQKKLEPLFWKNATVLTRALGLFISKTQSQQFTFASKDELRRLIEADQSVLEQQEKGRLLKAFDFNTAKLVDHMVVRSKIVVVDQAETVGPLLLDRLHKSGHNIFIVVNKNLDHVKGLLYMSDLVPLDPQIKTVKDAIRPTVHYLPDDAHLKDVLVASLKTGRQLFLATSKGGEVTGLITLRDALHGVLGEELGRESAVATQPLK